MARATQPMQDTLQADNDIFDDSTLTPARIMSQKPAARRTWPEIQAEAVETLAELLARRFGSRKRARDEVTTILRANDADYSTLLGLAETEEERKQIATALAILTTPLQLGAIASAEPPRLAEPVLPVAATMDARDSGAAKDYITATELRQAMHLTVSGTLTQFNAIVAAVLGAAMLPAGLDAIKIVVASALLLHVLAAFMLCWAARPTAEPSGIGGFAPLEAYHRASDTFANYRRGWFMTLLALAVSSIAACLFVLHAFVPDLTILWR